MAKNFFIKGALILTISSGIVRFMGFFYRIFISRTLGAEGIGIYQMILPIYVMALTFTSSGITLSVSKLVAEEKALNNKKGVFKILKCGFCLMVILALFASLVLLVLSPFISSVMLKEPRALRPLIMLIPGVIFCSFSALLRGFFYGIQDVKPPAESQIFEQTIKLGLCLLFLDYFSDKSLELGVLFIVGTVVLGEFLGFLHMFFRYLFIRKNIYFNTEGKGHRSKSFLVILRELLTIGMPLSISRISKSFFYMLEAALIPRQLVLAGFAREYAVALFGKLMGMAFPLLYIPSMITSSLAMTIIPEISEHASLNNRLEIQNKTLQALKITSLVSFGSCAIFFVLGKEIGMILYDLEMVGNMLPYLAIGSIFYYLYTTLASVLRGLGDQITPLKITLLTSIMVLALIYILMPIPFIGIYGYIFAYAISSITGTVLTAIVVNKNVKIFKYINYWLFIPAIPAIIYSVAIFFFYEITFSVLDSEAYRIFITLILASPFYIIAAFITKTINFKDFKKFFS